MAKLVSKRYALALFEAGLELNKLDEFKEEMNFLGRTIEDEPQLSTILEHPKVTKEEKKELIRAIFGQKLSQEMLNFIYLIIDKRRERYIDEVKEYYNFLYNEENNIIEATAVTAIPMDKQHQDKLSIVLSNRLGKKVILENLVDKNVVGGVLLKIENKLLDGTIKGRLNDIERSLKEMKVK